MRRSSCTSCMPARAMAWLFLPAISTPSSFTEPRARRHHAHQALQRGALAGAVAAEQRHHLVAARRAATRRTGCASRRSSCSGRCTSSRLMSCSSTPLHAAEIGFLHARRCALISSGVPSTSTRPSCSTVMRSASSNSESMSWSMMIMVRPWPIDFSSSHGLDALARAHAGERLVEQQQARRGGEREADLQPALLAIGELGDRRVAPRGEVRRAASVCSTCSSSPRHLRAGCAAGRAGTCRAASASAAMVTFSRTVRRLKSWFTW